MAENPKISFWRSAEAPNKQNKEGIIWFDSKEGRIKLYKNDKWDDYTQGNVVDAEYSSNVLTITKNVNGTLATVEIDLNGISGINELGNKIGQLETSITTINENIDAINGTLTGVNNSIADLQSAVSGIEDQINTKIENLDATVYSVELGEDAQFDIKDMATNHIAVKIVQTNGKVTDVDVYENNIASKSDLDDVNDKLDNLTSTLVGTVKNQDNSFKDANKSIREIATDVLTETLVAEDANAAYDTLQEVSAWIKNHPESAAAMESQISANKSSLENLTPRVDEIEETIETLTSAFEENDSAFAGIFNVLNDRISETIADITPGDYITVGMGTETRGEGDEQYDVTAATVGVITASIDEVEATNKDGLAVTSDVKTYIDNLLLWAEY